VAKSIKCEKCGNEFSSAIEWEPSDPFSQVTLNAQWCPRCKSMNWLTGTEVEANFKFGAVQKLARNYAEVEIANQSIDSVWAAFIKNMDRVLALGKMPTLLLFHWDFYLRVRDKLPAHRSQISLTFTDGTAIPLEPERLSVDDKVVDEWFSRLPNEGTYLALEGLLSSMILSAWTAFETFAGDFWETAINAHPADLSRLQGRWKDGSKGRQPGDSPKGVDLDRLAAHRFDVSRSMGSILRERWTFQALESIREAYERAFGRKCDNVRKALLDDSLLHLSALRHILVHRSGTVDREFKTQTASASYFAATKIGDRVKLDGLIVGDLISKMINHSVAMVTSVDKFVARK